MSEIGASNSVAFEFAGLRASERGDPLPFSLWGRGNQSQPTATGLLATAVFAAVRLAVASAGLW